MESSVSGDYDSRNHIKASSRHFDVGKKFEFKECIYYITSEFFFASLLSYQLF